jgi:hypothetical protein
MAEERKEDERPFVERWLDDQKEWQKTMLTYMDSMANNEDFLVHLGNAMRGSLLAGKPYPGTVAPAAEEAPSEVPDEPGAAADERLDRILFAIHELQGQLNDLQLTVDEFIARSRSNPADQSSAPADAGTTNAREPERDG